MRGLSCCVLILLLLLPAIADAQETSVFDVGPAFPRGPYSALYVDRSNPERVAVGTADGRVAFSGDAAQQVSETRVFSNRMYDAMAIRGNAKNSALGSQSGTRKTQRPVRLFIRTLGTGKGVAQWHFWRAITQPLTEVSAIALPVPGGRMYAAAPAGIMISDDKGGSWTRTLGGPSVMPNEKLDLVGLSVVANPADPGFVLAGTTEGVFVSRDGGMNFVPHTDPGIQTEMIFEWLWDPMDPSVVLAVSPDAILQSEDGGESFETAFVAPTEINQVVTSDVGVYVATLAGLSLVTAEGTQEIISGESVVGVVPWHDQGVLALTNNKLYHFAAGSEPRILKRTTDVDPFMRLDGAPGLAFLMSSSGVFRIGASVRRSRVKDGPVMLMSASKVQKSMLSHMGLGKPVDTRLHPRWYAKLLPVLSFNAVLAQGRNDDLMFDFTLPVDFRYDRAEAYAHTEFTVMAVWDLSNIVFGDHNVSNPDLFIESTLRANRQMILAEVRKRYREAAMLAERLQKPPDDPHTRLLWQMRLEEHASYLEFVSGRQVVKQTTPELQP